MPLSFRRRVFLGLVGLGTLPLAGALAVLVLELRGTTSPAGPARAALEEIATSGRRVMAAVDTTALAAPAREALRSHAASIARRTQLARRAELLSRVWTGAAVAVLLVTAILLVIGSLVLARRWSGYTSAPIEELVQWVHLIEGREPLPPPGASFAPEFDALRDALRNMASALDVARQREVEHGRLEAFRETARHVAHEMRGPLSAARLALARIDGDARARAAMAVDVLEQETSRLDRLAREFAEFGRLPEGPESLVDLGELLENVAGVTVPPGVTVARNFTAGLTVRGHHEPLRRAFQNLVKNAVEAGGPLSIAASREGTSVRVTVNDSGPGIPVDLHDRVFEPYFTTKTAGTGLGLALVKQTVNAHSGTVTIESAAGGGASFVVRLPEAS